MELVKYVLISVGVLLLAATAVVLLASYMSWVATFLFWSM